VQVAVRGVRNPPPDDTWVEVTGTLIPAPPDGYPTDREYVIELRPSTVVPIREPANPYESLW
jgi:hypothetical protein